MTDMVPTIQALGLCLAQYFAAIGSLPTSNRESRSALGKRKKYEEETPDSAIEPLDRSEKKNKKNNERSLERNSLSNNAPSTVSTVVCGHPIHPAYHARYAKPNCPICLCEYGMGSLKRLQDIIFANGGPGHWKTVTKGTDDYMLYKKAMFGAGKGSKTSSLNDNESNFNYRQKKILLLNLVTELEALSKMELAWGKKQMPNNRDIYFESVRLRKQYSATSALHEYYDTVDGGFIGRVESDSVIYDQNQCYQLSLEVAVDQDQQKKYIPLSTVSTSNDNDFDNSQTKSKRHRVNGRVRFNDKVYIRTEADVDILCRNALCERASSYSNGVAAFTEDKLWPGGFLISSPDLRAHGPLPDHVISLKTHDGRGPHGRLSSRASRRYSPGIWAVRAGSEAVDTSGGKKEYSSYEAYVNMLQSETETSEDQS
ncbi:tannase and feruloyl esterase [Pyrenophora seminiperda CCB06]|uniref:Tannase and feruloyl esterase n=1 Tax=Pyrenophora seminiperda CCB06 TaxID=1302712 RepID=A0A3M7LZ43_9PLEO|nr:tannase and feruloyl esterase [Pyrenophora seminiperda CCB06]